MVGPGGIEVGKTGIHKLIGHSFDGFQVNNLVARLVLKFWQTHKAKS